MLLLPKFPFRCWPSDDLSRLAAFPSVSGGVRWNVASRRRFVWLAWDSLVFGGCVTLVSDAEGALEKGSLIEN